MDTQTFEEPVCFIRIGDPETYHAERARPECLGFNPHLRFHGEHDGWEYWYDRDWDGEKEYSHHFAVKGDVKRELDIKTSDGPLRAETFAMMVEMDFPKRLNMREYPGGCSMSPLTNETICALYGWRSMRRHAA